MGFVFLDRYDVGACAQQCNTRGADAQGGACQYFNIWRAVVSGIPATYTCSMVSAHTYKQLAIIVYSTTFLPMSLQLLILDKAVSKSPSLGATNARILQLTAALKDLTLVRPSVSKHRMQTGSEQVPRVATSMQACSFSSRMPTPGTPSPC
jgi:hypothetical protein